MNQKDLIKYGLIVLGAYLIYEYIQTHGGIAGFFGGGNLMTPTNGQTATGAALAAAGALGFTGLTPLMVQAIAADTYTWNGTAWAPTACASGRVMNPGGQCQYIAQQVPGSGPITGGGTATGGGNPSPKAYVIDMAGLTVVPDVNDSLTGVIKINGIPTKLSIITTSGQIYDSTGTEITSVLQGEGIDVVAIRTAFQNAAPVAAPSGGSGGPCTQPNFYNPAGACVSGNTQDGSYGQPVPNTANRGMQGLGRVTPYWLM